MRSIGTESRAFAQLDVDSASWQFWNARCQTARDDESGLRSANLLDRPRRRLKPNGHSHTIPAINCVIEDNYASRSLVIRHFGYRPLKATLHGLGPFREHKGAARVEFIVIECQLICQFTIARERENCATTESHR